MKLNDQHKRELAAAIKKNRDALDNMERFVNEGVDPIILDKRASQHTAYHLRKVLKVLESIYRAN